MTSVVFRGVELPEGIRDVLVDGGIIRKVSADLPDVRGADIVDGSGCALLPGLHDHHLHLLAMAAAAGSVTCGPPSVRDPTALRTALADAPGTGWIRGVGYVETVAGLLNSSTLDEMVRDRPVRLQHRSGAVWFLNSRAADEVGLATADHSGIERDEAGAPTGRLWRADDWLRTRLPPSPAPDLASIGGDLARLGITGVTDATPDLTPDGHELIVEAHRKGALPQRLHLLGASIDGPPPPATTVTTGPYKIVLADSGLPDLDALCDTIRRAHAAGRGVAVHCVTREALLLLLVALDEAGGHRDDRLEHAAIVPPEIITDLAERGLRVITQPGFLAHRGDDYLTRVPERDLSDLYRCRSLAEAGVPLALSSDAPYGPVDPWRVMTAAVDRRAPNGRVVGADECLSPDDALGRYLAPLDDPGGPARIVAPGSPADLVLVAATRRDLSDATALTRDLVRCTMIRGDLAYAAGSCT